MIHTWIGLKVITNPLTPREQEFLVEDWEDRWEALVAHHLLLDVDLLYEVEPVVFRLAGDLLVMHPDTFTNLQQGLIPSISSPVPC
jgi:hypothetical protein